MTSIANQTILVTGANRGLGHEFVQQLVQRGATTVYAAARTPETITVTDPRIVPVTLDVTDPASVDAAAREVQNVAIVINNAGVSNPTSLLTGDTTNLRRELDTNLFGPLAVTSAFLDGIVEQNGAIVNVSSVLAWLAMGASYSVSKAALTSATNSLREELRPRGVQVVGVYMGYVETDMTAGVTAPKVSATYVVTQVLDGLEAGVDEVLADDTARFVHSNLTKPIGEQFAALTAVAANATAG